MNKPQKPHQHLTTRNKLIDLIIIAGVILGIYFHTLNRPWLLFDEIAIPEEITVPIPTSFNEIFEIINSFGTGYGFSSTNFLYTSNFVYRFIQLGAPFLLFLGYFLKKSALAYHSLNLFLHITSTVFVYLILNKCFVSSTIFNRLLFLSLTLIWSVHPAHVESILLTSNIGATFGYLIFFIIFYDFLINKQKNKSRSRNIVLPILFLLIPLALHEYIIVLPLVLVAYSFISNYKGNQFNITIKKAFDECPPYLIGLFIYLIYFLLSSYAFVQPTATNSSILFLERAFWLFPQIFIHFLKLIFFPITLSIDQSGLLYLGKSLFDIYAVLCFLLVSFCLLVPLILFLWKRSFYRTTLITSLFFLSLLPFSQIFSPTYCLIAERYLYIPIFFIVFGLAHFIYRINVKLSAIILMFLITIFCFLSIRTYIRTNDWKDNISLLNTTIKTSPNYLYKGFRTSLLANVMLEKSSSDLTITKAQKYFSKALKQFQDERKKYPNEPLILKSYGLDYNSLIIKSICLIALNSSIDDKVPEKYLHLFNPYLKYIESFDPRTLELYANLLFKNNEIIKAKEIFLFTYKKFPSSLFILESLIRFEREIEKDLPAAKQYLTEGLKLYPYSKEILFETLRHYQLENNLAEYAKYSYLYGLRTHSKFTYHEALAAYLTLEQLDKAKRVINKLIALDPYDPRTLYLSSSYYIKNKNYKQALSMLNQAYAIIQNRKPEEQLTFDITFTLANLYLAMGNTQQGIYHAKQALNHANRNQDNLVKIKKLLKDVGINP